MEPFSALILLWMFSATAHAHQCLTCSDDSCSSTTSLTCSSETMCLSATILDGGTGQPETQRVFKGCATSSVCPTTGDRTFSLDSVSSSVLASARCCDTDDCNGETLPAPNPQTDSGEDCFFCFPGQTDCQNILNCEGVEDRCFGGIGESSYEIFG
ncbi:unnamed protein product [Ophioblennius macclurei]